MIIMFATLALLTLFGSLAIYGAALLRRGRGSFVLGAVLLLEAVLALAVQVDTCAG